MKRKTDLDTTVGVLLNRRRDEVAQITKVFINELMNALVEEGEVHLSGFGRFLLKEKKLKPMISKLTKGRVNPSTQLILLERRYNVYFKKTAALTKKIHRRHGKAHKIQETDMDKYAVDESVDQEALEKKAAQGCPQCGRKPEKHGNVLMCPKCGTEPFEQK